MRFEFATAGRILFGPGTLREVGPLAREFGKRVLVVTGRDRNRAAALADSLIANGVECFFFSISGEPETATVESGVALAKEHQCEFVVAIGGGSAIDAGKAISAVLTNPGVLLDYLEVIGRGKSLAKAAAPFIAVPTTAGTGSEVTRNAVLASPEHRVKVSLRSPLMLPRVAVVDPELTYALPPAITASTGLDALTQLIEPFVCARANPMVDALCIEGIRRAARSLREVVHQNPGKSAREDMALASLFGGIALANAGLGAVHGFAGPMGGMFAAPHGALCAALLPGVMAANVAALRRRQPGGEGLRRYDEIARLLTGAAQADAGIEWVRLLVGDLQIPRLRTYGINHEHIAELVEKALQSSSMKANPIALTRDELGEALSGAI